MIVNICPNYSGVDSSFSFLQELVLDDALDYTLRDSFFEVIT